MHRLHTVEPRNVTDEPKICEKGVGPRRPVLQCQRFHHPIAHTGGSNPRNTKDNYIDHGVPLAQHGIRFFVAIGDFLLRCLLVFKTNICSMIWGLGFKVIEPTVMEVTCGTGCHDPMMNSNNLKEVTSGDVILNPYFSLDLWTYRST